MSKVIVDPGPIVEGPGKGRPPEFGKVELGEGWPSKWIGLGEALESENLPGEAAEVIGILHEEGLDGLLLPAVQAARESLPQIFVKVEHLRDLADVADKLDGFDDVVFLDPGGAGLDELQHKVQWGTFVKIGDIKGESQDTPEDGAWTPLSDLSDSDQILA